MWDPEVYISSFQKHKIDTHIKSYKCKRFTFIYVH